MVRMAIFCDTGKSAKRYATELYKYYIGIFKLSKDGDEYKPMLEKSGTKIFLPTSDEDIILIDFYDYINEEHFMERKNKIKTPMAVWRDRSLTGNKRSLCDLATMIAEIYFIHESKNMEECENGNEESDY